MEPQRLKILLAPFGKVHPTSFSMMQAQPRHRFPSGTPAPFSKLLITRPSIAHTTSTRVVCLGELVASRATMSALPPDHPSCSHSLAPCLASFAAVCPWRYGRTLCCVTNKPRMQTMSKLISRAGSDRHQFCSSAKPMVE